MNFIRGGGPTQQDVDRQRFEAARDRQRLEEELPPVFEPDPETVVHLSRPGVAWGRSR